LQFNILYNISYMYVLFELLLNNTSNVINISNYRKVHVILHISIADNLSSKIYQNQQLEKNDTLFHYYFICTYFVSLSYL